MVSAHRAPFPRCVGEAVMLHQRDCALETRPTRWADHTLWASTTSHLRRRGCLAAPLGGAQQAVGWVREGGSRGFPQRSKGRGLCSSGGGRPRRGLLGRNQHGRWFDLRPERGCSQSTLHRTSVIVREAVAKTGLQQASLAGHRVTEYELLSAARHRTASRLGSVCTSRITKARRHVLVEQRGRRLLALLCELDGHRAERAHQDGDVACAWGGGQRILWNL